MKHYSQFFDEPIIFRLIEETGIKSPGLCCEFGAADGLYNSNTAFLIRHCGWRGIFLEAKPVEPIISNYEGYDVDIRQVFVTVDNINYHVPENVDFISIDIDGNDYWIWKALKARPSVVVIECNHKTTNPDHINDYEEKYRRREDPKGMWNFGASPEMLIKLGCEIGYDYVDRDVMNHRPGPNLFFKRRE
jgi:hypothetical protein